MNLRKSIALVAPLAIFGLVASAHAAPPKVAPKPLVLTDQKGDANTINNAGLVGGTPIPEGIATEPASRGEFDITALTIAPTGAMATKKVGRKKVKYFNCTGYTASISLTAAPSTTASLYRVQASTQRLSQFWLQWNNPAGGTQSSKLRYTSVDPVTGTSTTTTVDLKVPAKAVENKVVFTVTAADLKAAGESLGKTVLTGLAVDTRHHFQVLTAPMYDQLLGNEAAAWKVCPV